MPIPSPRNEGVPHNDVGSFAEVRNGVSLFCYENFPDGNGTITHLSLTREMARFLVKQLQEAHPERRGSKGDRRKRA